MLVAISIACCIFRAEPSHGLAIFHSRLETFSAREHTTSGIRSSTSQKKMRDNNDDEDLDRLDSASPDVSVTILYNTILSLAFSFRSLRFSTSSSVLSIPLHSSVHSSVTTPRKRVWSCIEELNWRRRQESGFGHQKVRWLG